MSCIFIYGFTDMFTSWELLTLPILTFNLNFSVFLAFLSAGPIVKKPKGDGKCDFFFFLLGIHLKHWEAFVYFIEKSIKGFSFNVASTP